MGSKASEGAKAMSLAFVLLDFQPADVLNRCVFRQGLNEEINVE